MLYWVFGLVGMGKHKGGSSNQGSELAGALQQVLEHMHFWFYKPALQSHPAPQKQKQDEHINTNFKQFFEFTIPKAVNNNSSLLEETLRRWM